MNTLQIKNEHIINALWKERSDIMEKNKKARFTTTIDEGLLKKIKVKAIEEGKNVNEIIEELLRKYLKR